ncbi:uncharacterized protein A1O9_03380 [Exophiala aquamarina CBS 119918]|uniref:Uncharacterized protein n=1 Tax=Exophiala aquamarina CBS 119918 TaxID=1182545 RepID=A0A072Q1S1_9EURO|nr:uncharacterized protein A1O9_03380 [Exophiala aquamarina CBS 119918]KEF61810.1 hypothetical protein A1O9_03380 [Exophiala aquamarina CBS 119918]
MVWAWVWSVEEIRPSCKTASPQISPQSVYSRGEGTTRIQDEDEVEAHTAIETRDYTDAPSSLITAKRRKRGSASTVCKTCHKFVIMAHSAGFLNSVSFYSLHSLSISINMSNELCPPMRLTTCDHSERSSVVEPLWTQQPNRVDQQDQVLDFPKPLRQLLEPHFGERYRLIDRGSPFLSSSSHVSSATPKNSVNSLVDLFEARERLDRAPNRHLQRASVQPSSYLRERYSTALSSQRQPSSEYRPQPFTTRPHLRGKQIQQLEKALTKRLTDQSLASQPLISSSSQASTVQQAKASKPQIKVLTSGQSVSIIIPRGVQLPIIATIQPAGYVNSQMSEDTPHVRSESSNSPTPTSSAEPGPSQDHRRARNSESATPQSEGQGFPVGFGLPFLARVRKGRLNVSEASVPAPTSSDISATGEVFTPAHHHPSEWEGKIYQRTQTFEEIAADRATSVPETPQEAYAQQSKTADNYSGEDILENKTAEQSGSDLAQHDQSSTSQPNPNVFGEILERIPVIRIQRPSTPTMAASLGTSVVSRVAGATSVVPAAATPSLPIDAGSATSALPVGALTSTLLTPPPVPGLSGGGKKAKLQKLTAKIRKQVVRKRLLALLLGREVANLVHPLLSQIGNTAGAVPL